MFKKFLAFLKSLLPVKFSDGLQVPPEIEAKISILLMDAKAKVEDLRAAHSVKSVKATLAEDLAAVDASAARIKDLLRREAAGSLAGAKLVLPPINLGSTGPAA